jgi:hypothetical protein
LANFLSISPNQTKFLLSVCLVPGLDFSAIPIQSLQCLYEGYQLIYFLYFKVVKWAASSLTHSSNFFRVFKHFYFNIHDSNVA